MIKYILRGSKVVFMKKEKIIKVVIYIAIIYVIIGTIYLGYRFIFRPVTLSLKGAEEVTISLNETFKDPGFKLASIKKVNDSVIIINNVNNKVVGTYDVIYQYKNIKKVRKVKVIDDIAPIITLNGKEETYVCPNKTYKEEGYKVTDNYDKNLTDTVNITKEKDQIIYEVKDNSNNTTKIIRKLIYEDKTAPKITLISEKRVIYQGEDFKDNFQATDNCDGNITNKVIKKGTVNVNEIGTYKITYEVTDQSQNKTTKEQIVEVKSTPKNSGTVYLTFDDGPSTTATPIILDTLKKYNIKATFFVINHGTGTDYLLKRETEEGHTIGYHTASHNYSYIYENETNFWNDLSKIENKVKKVTNTNSKIFRFPGGSSNTVSYKNKGIMTRLAKQSREKGYIYQDWNVGSLDTTTQNSETICNNVIKSLGRGTNIVLMHDSNNKTGSAKAVECIIKKALARGYDFEKITTDTKEIHHSINN